jgi:molybdopterin-guanine dinucleotide biosynthesis protein A
VTAVSGIVLAGGLSKRLGTDKALLPFGGRTLLEVVVGRLREATEDIVIACGAGQRPGWPTDVEARLVLDRVRGRGPLAGLEAGLRAAAHNAAAVVACDMPFLNPALLRYMVDLLEHNDAVAPVVNGRLHALHAVYTKRCLGAIDELLARGGSMQGLLETVRTVIVAEDAVLAIDPAGLSCFNLNSPADLEKARSLWPHMQAAL